MSISLIVSMYNRSSQIIRIIDSLFFPSLIRNASTDIELVIIDDCSPFQKETQTVVDKYLPVLKSDFGSVVFTRNSCNFGFARSYNIGMRMASGEQLLITNDDVYFPRGSIANLARTLKEPAGYLVAGHIVNASTAWSYQYCKQAPVLKSYASEELAKLEAFALFLERKMAGRRLITDNLYGFCFIADAGLLREMGGFDERYAYGLFEDTDLVQRIVREYSKKVIAINLGVFVGHGGIHGSSRSIFQLPAKLLYYTLVNGCKYANSWGWGTLAMRLRNGLLSQFTGKGTISELL